MSFASIKETENRYSVKTRRQNICFVRGEGNKLFDTTDRAYIDFVSGLGENCLGYNNPTLTAAVCEQTKKIINGSSLYYSESQATLSENLVSDTIFNQAFICSSQLDAFLALVSMIRRYCRASKDERTTILVVSDNRYIQPEGDANGAFKFKTLPYGDKHRLKRAFTGDIGAVIVAPVMSDAGVVVMDNDFLLSLYALTKAAGALFTVDETNIGYGRTGTRFAFEHYGIMPDAVAVSRGLGGGIILGALLMRGEAARCFAIYKQVNWASNLACEAANVVVSRLSQTELGEIADKGEHLISRLAKLKKYNFVLDIRGKGLLIGMELANRLSAAKIVGQMSKRGFLLNNTLRNTLRFMPPFTITYQEIDEMVDALGDIFSETNI